MVELLAPIESNFGEHGMTEHVGLYLVRDSCGAKLEMYQ